MSGFSWPFIKALIASGLYRGKVSTVTGRTLIRCEEFVEWYGRDGRLAKLEASAIQTIDDTRSGPREVDIDD